MVAGIDKFREHFAEHQDQYAIIGGAACDLLFGSAGLDFRATRDIDVVLCVDVFDVAFARAFEAFLDAGGYQARERSGGTKEFYRFHRPTDPSFPYMIELFSRRPGTLELPEDAVLTPIPVEDDVISLSADPAWMIATTRRYIQRPRSSKASRSSTRRSSFLSRPMHSST